MKGICVLFPGQGSQKVGMGKDFYEKFPSSKKVFQTADEILGFPLTKLIFEGPEDELKITYNTQPALLTTFIAMWEGLKEYLDSDLEVELTAGHSLGEYASHVITGSLSFEEAVQLVRKRGEFMQEAVPVGKGTMAAMLGAPPESVEELCRRVQKEGFLVEPVNYNSLTQTVVAGTAEGVDRAVELHKEHGIKKAIKLKVSAPFHSSLMKPAAERMKVELEKATFTSEGVGKLITNYRGELLGDGEEVESLYRQVDNPVRWVQSMNKAFSLGYLRFLEVGPGRVLKGLMRDINKNAEVQNLYSVDVLEKVREFIK